MHRLGVVRLGDLSCGKAAGSRSPIHIESLSARSEFRTGHSLPIVHGHEMEPKLKATAAHPERFADLLMLSNDPMFAWRLCP
jgi:hypothetical protein